MFFVTVGVAGAVPAVDVVPDAVAAVFIARTFDLRTRNACESAYQQPVNGSR